jgi:hypothetical protein
MKAIQTLRRKHRYLEPDRALSALDRALAVWRAPDSLWRARLVREHPLFSPEVIERGVVEGLEGWTGEALAALIARETRGGAFHVPPVTAVWLAGSIPTAAFGAILLPLLAGSAVWARPASADPTSPRLFADALRAVDERVAAAVAIAEPDFAPGADNSAPGAARDPLEAADAVVAYGSDETIAKVRARVPSDRPFVAYGHKLSLAAVGPAAELEPAAEAVALDIALWDGRGCLSPAAVLVEDEPTGRSAEFAVALADALERLARELPRGALDDAEHAWTHDVRAGSAAREDVRVLCPGGPLEWCVVLSSFDRAPPFLGRLRVVPVIQARTFSEITGWCETFAPHLSSLGHAGFEEQRAELMRSVLRAGGSRMCDAGRMQTPPIDWRHDGIDPIRPLLRFIDDEREPSGEVSE